MRPVDTYDGRTGKGKGEFRSAVDAYWQSDDPVAEFGPLHEQDWAVERMCRFHDEMQRLEFRRCHGCNEWELYPRTTAAGCATLGSQGTDRFSTETTVCSPTRFLLNFSA